MKYLGELNYLFGGDSERKRLEEALEYELPEVELYKVPHHGKWNSKSEDMIDKISPKTAIITNSFADSKIIKALRKQNTKIYYTANKSFRFLSDGLVLREK